jgi:hypothetical protein
VRKPIVVKAPVWKAAALGAALGLATVPYPAHAASGAADVAAAVPSIGTR